MRLYRCRVPGTLVIPSRLPRRHQRLGLGQPDSLSTMTDAELTAVVADAERIPFPTEAITVLRAAGVRPVLADGHDAGTIAQLAEHAAALLVRHGWWGAAELDRFVDLRVVARCGTG